MDACPHCTEKEHTALCCCIADRRRRGSRNRVVDVGEMKGAVMLSDYTGGGNVLELCPIGNNNMLLFNSDSLLIFISLSYNCCDI